MELQEQFHDLVLFTNKDIIVSYRLLCLLLLLCQSCPTELCADEPSPEFVLAGYRDSCEKIRNGEFRVEGILVNDREDFGRLEGPVTIYSAFDFEANKIRFDRTGPIRELKANKAYIAGKDDWKLGTEGGKYVWMPERSISFWNNDDAVVIRHGDHTPHWAHAWDVRTVGLMTTNDYAKFPHYPMTIDNIQARVDWSKAKVTRQEPGIVRLEFPGTYTRTVLDFDEDKGYVLISLSLGGLISPLNPSPTIQTWTHVDYRKFKGVWVPSYFWVGSGGKPGIGESYEFNFTWLKLNESIPPETFMTRGLELPTGTVITQARGNDTTKSLHLGKIGDLEPNPLLLEMEPPTPWAWWVWALIGVGVVVVLIGVGYGVWQLRKRRIA